MAKWYPYSKEFYKQISDEIDAIIERNERRKKWYITVSDAIITKSKSQIK